jgi:hypothetical protein
MDAPHKTGSAASATIDEDPWLTLNAASDVGGKARNTILLAALDGRVRHVRVAGRRVFHREDVERLRDEANSADEDA